VQSGDRYLRFGREGRNSHIFLECARQNVNKCHMLSDIAVFVKIKIHDPGITDISISSKYFTLGTNTVKIIVHECTFPITSLITG
jgi:hypothetical protein